jgi:hypothetical protein
LYFFSINYGGLGGGGGAVEASGGRKFTTNYISASFG